MPEEPAWAPPREEVAPDLLANVTDALRATADEWISSLNSVGQGWFGKLGPREEAVSRCLEAVGTQQRHGWESF